MMMQVQRTTKKLRREKLETVQGERKEMYQGGAKADRKIHSQRQLRERGEQWNPRYHGY